MDTPGEPPGRAKSFDSQPWPLITGEAPVSRLTDRAEDFREELQAQLRRAQKQGRPHIEINSGELHRTLGGYPPKAGQRAANIPSCCAVMWCSMRSRRSPWWSRRG